MIRSEIPWAEHQKKERASGEVYSTVLFYRRILTSLPSFLDDDQGVVLEIGSGPSGGFKTVVPCAAFYAVDSCWGDVASPWGDLRIQAEALPMEDGTFDLCIVSNALDHCDDPIQVAKEMMRVAKPGGKIFVGHYLPQTDPHPWAFDSVAEMMGLFAGFEVVLAQPFDTPGREGYTIAVFEKPRRGG